MSSYQELYAAWYVWRPTHPKKSKKGRAGDKGVASALLALPFRPTAAQTAAQFARLERRTPQVMVKVTKATFGASHTYQNMTYIARNCEKEILDQDGCLYKDNSELERLAADWHQQNRDAYDGERRYRGPDARRMQFSMPADTDPIALRNAVAATARHVFGDRFDYVYALHTDRPHPHVHLTIRAVSHDGQALRINKDDLLYLRRTMALELRTRGVEADATPQIARGARVKHDKTEVHRHNQRSPAQARQSARGKSAAKVDPYVLRVYSAAARRLRATASSEDIKLAERIERFTASRFPQNEQSAGQMPENAQRPAVSASQRDEQAGSSGGKGRGQRPKM